MTEAQAIEAILQYWEAGWAPLNPAIPWTADGEVFEAVTSFVEVQISHSDRHQVTIGSNRRFATTGTIQVVLHGDINVGRQALAELADDVRAVLEGVAITALGIDEPVVTFAGSTQNETTEGRWMMSTVSVPFRYDRIR